MTMQVPFDLDAVLAQHAAALRRLAGELVRDPTAAEDAVQEVWLGALRAPPPHQDSVGGWLATALRNVVRKVRRGEDRRRRREEMAASWRGAVHDPAVAAAREELAQRLVAAVGQLEPPCRDAIWQRYFVGLSPRGIARQGGVPLATVKSRLQRGLRQLRERFGEESGADWRRALAVAFGPGTGAAATAAWSGTALKTVGTKAAAAILVVAAGMWWWTAREPGGNTAIDVDRTAAVAATGGRSDDAPVRTGEGMQLPAGPPAERVLATVPATEAASREAVVRGRCVDEQGAPLAGASVQLAGRADDRDRREAWLAEHGALPSWRAPEPARTGADGRFEIAFVPPPPFAFSLAVGAEGRVGREARWTQFAEGEQIDVGDVVLRAGVRVAGRVVDRQGKGVPGASLSMQEPLVAGRALFRDDTFAQAETDSTGRFEVAKPMPAGRFLVSVRDHEVLQPLCIVAPEPASQELVITVAPPAPMVRITGTVVDEAGAAVAEARIEVEGEGLLRPTGADGAFVLEKRREAVRGDARISIHPHLHEPLQLPDAVPWGTQGLVLTVRRGAELTVRVTDAAGAPVDEFALRLVRKHAQWTSYGGSRVLARGPFVDGTARVPSVPRGEWLVWIEPPEGAPVAALTASLTIADAAPRRLDLTMASARRTVRVVDRRGEPIAGSAVRAADPVAGPIDERTRILPLARFAAAAGGIRLAILVAEGRTDAAGEFVVAGPVDAVVSVLVDGPGHLPAARHDERLGVPDPLVVVVDRGGRVVGRIEPPAALAELRRLAGLPPAGPIPADRASNWATVTIAAANSAGRPVTAALTAEGSFAARGVTPGPVVVRVHVGSTYVTAAPLEVREGETTEAAVDLVALLPGTLSGLVTWNGVPLANETLRLDVEAPSAGERPDLFGCDVRTDAQGRFEHRGRPGRYSLTLQRPGRAVLRLRAASEAVVARDQVVHHIFAIASGTLEVTLLEPNGRPAMVGQFVAVAEPARPAAQLARSDDAGPFRTEIEPGDYELFVLPDGAELMRRLQASPEDPNELMRRLRVKVGAATVVAGQTTSLTLRLP